MPSSIPGQVIHGAGRLIPRAAAALPGLGLLLGAGGLAAGVAAIPAAAGAFAAANSRVSSGLQRFSPELQQAAAEQRVLDTERKIDLAQRYGADLARTQRLSGLAYGIGETAITDFLADFSAILRGDFRRAIDQTDFGMAVATQIKNWWSGPKPIRSIFNVEHLPNPPEFASLWNNNEDITDSSDVSITGLGF